MSRPLWAPRETFRRAMESDLRLRRCRQHRRSARCTSPFDVRWNPAAPMPRAIRRQQRTRYFSTTSLVDIPDL